MYCILCLGFNYCDDALILGFVVKVRFKMSDEDRLRPHHLNTDWQTFSVDDDGVANVGGSAEGRPSWLLERCQYIMSFHTVQPFRV
jgi:hypothetical protein